MKGKCSNSQIFSKFTLTKQFHSELSWGWTGSISPVFCVIHCTKKWSFAVRISSVSVTKSGAFCEFGHISLIENFIFCTVIIPNPKMCCSSKFLLFYHFHHRAFRIICENPETMHFQKISTNISPFIPNAPFLYAQKTSENLTVFWCSQELEKRYIGNKWVNWKNGTLCSEWSHGIYN